MKFDILDVVSLDDYSIKEEDRSCEMCGHKENTHLAIIRYATNLTPQEDEILCEKCLKREGWKRKKRIEGGYGIMEYDEMTAEEYENQITDKAEFENDKMKEDKLIEQADENITKICEEMK